ncbi:LuxR C-terminal-related transcriptional regulator [Microbispora sp. H10830]|uniref:ATP-binding protein n=1 Tax=Microbispora sp. H10830 TaxID=2729109 RepID=UPI001600022E|nr:LuxR C-terminal-related transcriptional regulator [Microbispora sp. H10830]
MRHHEGGPRLPDRLARAGVTGREAEILWAVAERLRNREIAERLHVSVRTVESHIAALLRKLGAADRAALAETGARLRRAARAGAVLPAPLTSLVGRAAETSELVALLGTHRLVTLIGPGGVGKTRLALHVAESAWATALADRFPGGIRLADLAPVEPESVGDTFARALGVVPEPGWPLRDILREVAAGSGCLLLADNCEHVVAEAAEIVADLLGAGGALQVLATSREPLGIPGEVAYQVRALPLPAADASERAESIAPYDAVRLFVDRATAASPGFALTDTVAPAVAALCRRLDGLPLAIELAASRLRTFGPVELVEHLDQRFELLSAGARTAPPRHRALRSTIDWSYQLLDHGERALFDRLGVFPADFDLAAIVSACEGEDLGGEAVITLLPRLVDKSLVCTVGRGTRRYRLLETIRAYAAQRLAGSGGEQAARRRHAAHYLVFAEQAAERLRTSDQRAWLDRMTMEQPNLHAALAHDIGIGDVESVWRMIAALQRFWDVTGRRRDAHKWVRQALAVADPPATPAVVAGLTEACLILDSRDARAAFDLARKAASLAAGLDDVTRARAARAVGMSATWIRPELVAPALQEALAGFGDEHPWDGALTMQGIAITTADLSRALQWGRDSAAFFRRAGDQICAANTLYLMAQRSLFAGIAGDEVHGWLTESRALAEAAGSEADMAHATVGFGQLAWLRGDHDRAAELMSECLPTLRRLGDRRCTGRALHMLGQRAYENQEPARAEELLRASVEAIALAGQSFVLVSALEALAAVYAAQQRPRSAAVLLGTAHSVREAAGAHMRPPQPPDQELRHTLVRILGTGSFVSAHAQGERLSPAETLRLVPFDEPGSSRTPLSEGSGKPRGQEATE